MKKRAAGNKNSDKKSTFLIENNTPEVIHRYPRFLEWLSVTIISIFNHPAAPAFCWLLLPIAYIAFYPVQIDDYDIWFHLAYGRHYVENLTFNIDHSQFSWTPANPDWKYGTWLGSAALYLVYRVSGLPGLVILQIGSLSGVLYILYRYIKFLDLKPGLLQIFSFLLILISFKLTAIYIKPEMFSTFFFAVAVGLYFYARTEKGNAYLALWLYPVLFFLWVNTHGGFIIGLFFVSFALVLEIGAYFMFRDQAMQSRTLTTFLYAVGLSYLAILANPQNVDYPMAIIKGIAATTPALAGHYSSVVAYQSLWNHLQFTMEYFNFVVSAWIIFLMAATYAWLTFYTYFCKKLINIPILVLNVFFFYLSMKMARAAMFYPVLWFFSCSYIIWKNSLHNVFDKLLGVAGAVHVALCAFIVYVSVCYDPARERLWFGFENAIPVKEIEFIIKNKIPGPIFNDYVTGAYLMWAMYPDYKVFIDPRWGPYQGYDSQKDWDSISQYLTPDGYRKFIDKYPFKIAIIKHYYKSITFWLLETKEWGLTYFDKSCAVLVHTSVVSQLSQDVLNTDVSPNRFNQLRAPDILMDLFNFYNNLHPKYGRQIRDIYQRNVTEFYHFKDTDIEMMNQNINQAETIRKPPGS